MFAVFDEFYFEFPSANRDIHKSHVYPFSIYVSNFSNEIAEFGKSRAIGFQIGTSSRHALDIARLHGYGKLISRDPPL